MTGLPPHGDGQTGAVVDRRDGCDQHWQHQRLRLNDHRSDGSQDGENASRHRLEAKVGHKDWGNALTAVERDNGRDQRLVGKEEGEGRRQSPDQRGNAVALSHGVKDGVRAKDRVSHDQRESRVCQEDGHEVLADVERNLQRGPTGDEVVNENRHPLSNQRQGNRAHYGQRQDEGRRDGDHVGHVTAARHRNGPKLTDDDSHHKQGENQALRGIAGRPGLGIERVADRRVVERQS